MSLNLRLICIYCYVFQSKEILSQRDHNHAGDDNAIQALTVKSDMNRMAETGRACPHQILTDAITLQSVAVRAAVGKIESVKRTLRRHKRGNLPKMPERLEDLSLDDEWQTTGGDNPSSFMIYDSRDQRPDRLIVFATDEALTRLALSNVWFMDGTFGCAPALFQQLYVIRVLLGDNSISCVYAFMSTKTTDAYEVLFRTLIDKCRSLGFDLDPHRIVIDFEQSVIAAIKNIFGTGVQTRGCFFHLTQSTWRKIQELGLVRLYKENGDVRHFSGMMDGLAFLPLTDVPLGLNHLKSVVPDMLVPLLEYFDSTYVSGPLRSVKQPDNANGGVRLRLKRSAPLFPPSLWNVHDSTLNDEARTNNLCEAWNNGFRTTVGHNHPCVWTAIEAIRKDQAISSTHIYKHEHGEPDRKRVRRETKENQERLKKLCSEYRYGSRNLQDFMRAVGYCIRVF